MASLVDDEPTISVVITAHPSRRSHAVALREQLPLFDTRIVLDPDPDGPPSAIRTAAAAWSGVPDAATHQLVLQDDASLGEDFAADLIARIRVRPNDPLVLYSAWAGREGHAIRMAALTGHSWCELPGPAVPGVALLLPRHMGLRLGEFLNGRMSDRDGRDSVAMWDFFADVGVRPLASVPNLASHDLRRIDSLWTQRASTMANSTDVKSGLRRSVCFSSDVARRGDPRYPAMSFKVPVPHPSFDSAHARVSTKRGFDGPWDKSTTIEWLAERGWPFRELVEHFDAAVHADGDGVSTLLGRPMLFELWLTCFTTGLVLGSDIRVDYATDPIVAAAVATLIPGALRRVLAQAQLESLQANSSPFVIAGIRAGQEAPVRSLDHMGSRCPPAKATCPPWSVHSGVDSVSGLVSSLREEAPTGWSLALGDALHHTRHMLCTIIGAGPGLGTALAERFAHGGFDVALVSRSPDRLVDWRSGRSHPERFALHRADAADADDMNLALAEIQTWRGDSDVLIYNVADMTPDPVDQLTTEQLLDTMRTNVGGALTSLHYVLPAMRRRRRGTILFTGGGLSIEPYPAWSSLAAGKAALRSIAINLYKELLPQGIHVAVVAVCGIIQPDGPFASDQIAEQYWRLHRQPLNEASRELIYAPEGADPYYNDPLAEYRGTSQPISPPIPRP